MSESKIQTKDEQLAKQVRDACFQSVVEACEEAKTHGLCHEGAKDSPSTHCVIASLRLCVFA